MSLHGRTFLSNKIINFTEKPKTPKNDNNVTFDDDSSEPIFKKRKPAEPAPLCSLTNNLQRIPPTYCTGEPILINPNSFDRVEKVLTRVQSTAGVGETRIWTIVGCHGVLYVMGSKII